MNFLANILTALSLFSGFLSIVFSLQHHFSFACWAIIISVVFDGLDGQIARINPAPSGFGKEFDSLVDVVAFGIAPALLGYIYIYGSFQLGAVLALFVYLLCSVLRLAKYNITPKETMSKCFHGLPTTVSGGVLASFVLIYRRGEGFIMPGFVSAAFLLVVLVLSLLMISPVKYLNLDGIKLLLGKYKLFAVVLLGAILAFCLISGKVGIAVALAFLIYLLFSPFMVKSLNSNGSQPR